MQSAAIIAAKCTNVRNSSGSCAIRRAAERHQATGSNHMPHAQPNSAPSRRRWIEEAIARLAAAQHGVVSRTQLTGVGVSGDTVDRMIGSRRLLPLHRGVYRASSSDGQHAREMAAVLACGESAVVSHGSAAVLCELAGHADPNRVDITITRGHRGRMPGVRIHRIPTLRSDEATLHRGIPVTTVPRTICDLAGVSSRRDLERMVARAMRRELTDRDALLPILARHPRMAGSAVLRAMLESDTVALTRSEAEERFLALIRRGGLPTPAANVQVAGHEVDFYWRRERFVVEIDGYAFHASTVKFERDRRRDAILAAAGVRVTRVTWRQLMHESEAVLVRLTQALALDRA